MYYGELPTIINPSWLRAVIMSNLQDNRGIFTKYSVLMVRFSRLIDMGFIFICLWAVVLSSKKAWSNEHLLLALSGMLVFEIIGSFFGLYRSWRTVRIRYEIFKVLLYWFICSSVILFFNSLYLSIRNDLLIKWIFSTPLLLIGFRICQRIFLRFYRAYGCDHKTVAFIGATQTAWRLAQSFKKYSWMGLDIVGFFDDRVGDPKRDLYISNDKLIGNVDDLIEMAQHGKIDIVYITLPMAAETRIKEQIERLSNTVVNVFYAPSILSFNLLNASYDVIDGQPLFSIITSPFNGSMGLLKRVEDLVIAIIAFPILFIPMLIVAIIIKATSPGPVFYKQKRYGLNGQIFEIYKFRSMTQCDSTDEFVQATKNDSRVTLVGRFIRKTSIDELPQLINVLKGQMSIVGPRPHPVKLDNIQRGIVPRYMSRNLVKPGITGLAQINGFRGETDTLDKIRGRIEYDLQYIDNWSLSSDFKIIFKTAFKVFQDEKAY